MTPLGRLRWTVAGVVLAQLAIAFSLLTASGAAPFEPPSETLLFAGLSCGSSQATLLAGWMTLGRGSLTLRLVGGFLATAGLVACYEFVLLWGEGLQRLGAFMVGYGAALYAVVYPLIPTLVAGAIARRNRCEWSNEPRGGERPTLSRTEAWLAAVSVLSVLALIVAAWREAEALERWWLDQLTSSGLDTHVALFGVASIVSSLLAVGLTIDAPRRWPALVALSGWTGLIGVLWLRCPHTLHLVATGAVVAFTLTLGSLLALRAAGWRIVYARPTRTTRDA